MDIVVYFDIRSIEHASCISRIGYILISVPLSMHACSLLTAVIVLDIYLSAFAHLDLVGRPVESVAEPTESYGQ